MATRRNTWLILLVILAVTGCTLAQPAPTPTSPPQSPTAAATPSATPTLRPTPQALFTPTAALPTPLPISTSAGGDGGFASGSTGGSDTRTAAPVAPLGERVTVQPSSITPDEGSPAVTDITPTVPPTYNEAYPVTVPANGTIVIQYEIEATGGSVVLWVISPAENVIWQQTFTETTTGEAEVSPGAAGTYEIRAAATNLRGFYSISYGLR